MGTAAAGPAERPSVNAEQEAGGSVGWSQPGECRHALRSPPTLLSLEGRAAQSDEGSEGGKARALTTVGWGPRGFSCRLPRPPHGRDQSPRRGSRPRASGRKQHAWTRPAHWALAAASPEDTAAAAPRLRRPSGPPSSAAGRERAQAEQTSSRTCHGPANGPKTLPGDVEGQRGPQNRVAPELPERRAEGSHCEATQAAAPTAAGT